MDTDTLITFACVAFAGFITFIKLISRIAAKQKALNEQLEKRQQQNRQEHQMVMDEERPQQQERPRKKHRPSFQDFMADLFNQTQRPQQKKQPLEKPQPLFEEGERTIVHHETTNQTAQPAEPWKGVEGLTEAQKLFVYSEIIQPKYQDDLF